MLSPNLSVFWDPVAGCWMLIGQVGDPRAYATEQEVEEVLSLGELQRGKKVRLSHGTPKKP